MSGRQIAVGEQCGMLGGMELKREVDWRRVSFEALFIANGTEAVLTAQRSESRLSLLAQSIVRTPTLRLSTRTLLIRDRSAISFPYFFSTFYTRP
jgi:hypothetical protein